MGKTCKKKMETLQSSYGDYLKVLMRMEHATDNHQEGLNDLKTMDPGPAKDKAVLAHMKLMGDVMKSNEKDLKDKETQLDKDYTSLKKYFEKKTASKQKDKKYDDLKALIVDVGKVLDTLG